MLQGVVQDKVASKLTIIFSPKPFQYLKKESAKQFIIRIQLPHHNMPSIEFQPFADIVKLHS